MSHLLEGLLIGLKLLGTLFAGVFGVLGLATDYRDKETDQVTRWGHLSLLGILISTVVALSSQVVETVLAKRDATVANCRLATQLAISNDTLGEVERSILPLKEMTISYRIEIPVQSKAISAYKRRIESGIHYIENTRSANIREFEARTEGDTDGRRVIVLGPRLRPSKGDGAIFEVMRDLYLDIRLYRQPFDSERFFGTPEENRGSPDLGFNVGSRSIDVDYELPAGKLFFEVKNAPVDESHWKSDYRIESILDLSQAQLMAVVVASNSVDATSSDAEARSPIGELWVNSMSMAIAGRSFDRMALSRKEGYALVSMPALDPIPHSQPLPPGCEQVGP